MRLFAFIVPLASALLALANTPTAQVTYDPIYDDPNLSLNLVACSNGPNGLITKGFTTLGSLPKFPYIGGSSSVAGWNSPSCGGCWSLTHNNKTIFVTAVDHAASGFNIALTAMNELTDGHAVEFGKVFAVISQADKSKCGF